MKNLDFLLIILLLLPTLGSGAGLPESQVTVEVKDDDNNPVENATVGVAGARASDAAVYKKGATDPAGIFTARCQSNGAIGVTAVKPGYYRSELWKAYSFLNAPGAMEKAFATKRWEPWNPHVQMLLKKINHPVPMFARRFNKGIPSTSDPIGFDFAEGDFVKPVGRGRQTDIIFSFDRQERSKDDYDYKIHVRFPNKADGITPFQAIRSGHGSELASPYIAPENGLASEWTLWRSRRLGTAETSNCDPENRGYFFRIRTITDNSGKIATANYGKIYGEFMDFTYYVNPTPTDRNVEFDTNHNLFTNLKPEEQINAP